MAGIDAPARADQWHHDRRSRIIKAARDMSPVSGLTHGFYRYPARFSPFFVRGAIEEFTEPGDWVFDPFAGGGTTLVEAMASGRNSLGIDISSLSAFVCEAKTQLVTSRDVRAFERWMARIPGIVNMHEPGFHFGEYADAGYYRNLEGAQFWRIRKAIEQCLVSVERLRPKKPGVLARCTVLRTAQWALDSRKKLPSVGEFRDKLSVFAAQILEGATELRQRVEALPEVYRPIVRILNRQTKGAEMSQVVGRTPSPKLIVTSPPYPGIHVLYHRWQVDGRREAPAPFWIANKLDGAGLSHYTLGDRKNPGLRTYFQNLRENFSSISQIAGPETVIVQMVAFSDREWQLPKYLQTMEECGLEEVIPWGLDDFDQRLWRDVPNRKWHASQKIKANGAKEVVLVHRKS